MKIDGNSAVGRVMTMSNNAEYRAMAKRHGLDIMNVSWDDTSRYKNSSVGSNITDLTLQMGQRRLPLIRAPNFSDLTFDVPIEHVGVSVGNQASAPLASIPLKQYLTNIDAYLTMPGSHPSLLAPRDTHVLMSTQACLLPIEQAGVTSFNVAVRNYQSSPSAPAVLCIVATSKGTSAQVIDTSGVKTLRFNKGGQAASFVAQRLTDDRIARGVPTEGAMTTEEKANNMVMVIQVPLVRRPRPFGGAGFGGAGTFMAPFMYPSGIGAFGNAGSASAMPTPCAAPQMAGAMADDLFSSAAPTGPPPAYGAGFAAGASSQQQQQQASSSFSMSKRMTNSFGSARGGRGGGMRKKADMEAAIVHVGHSEGPFQEPRATLVRDTSAPIRVTLQYYQATSDGMLTDTIVSSLSAQFARARSNADFVGSLVTGGFTIRPTEATPIPSPPKAFHPGVVCDGCGSNVAGIRWKCSICADFDLCETCEVTHPHGQTHPLLKLRQAMEYHTAMALSVANRGKYPAFGNAFF